MVRANLLHKKKQRCNVLRNDTKEKRDLFLFVPECITLVKNTGKMSKWKNNKLSFALRKWI